MIILEFLKDLFLSTVRFFVWIITARDCKHCKYYQTSFLYGYSCSKKKNEIIECLTSVTRKHFKRESEDSND